MSSGLVGISSNKDPWEDSVCGECKFFLEVRGHKKVILTDPTPKECRESPPQTVFILQPGQGGGMIGGFSISYPRYSEDFPACSRFKKKNSC